MTANQLAYELRVRSIKAYPLVGMSSREALVMHDEAETQKQLEVFTNFVNKQFKVLVATAAVEEGVDVSEVDTVIAYDSILNFKSFVQAKGRCRKEAQGRKSKFLIFCNNEKEEAKARAFERLEEQVLSRTLQRTPGNNLMDLQTCYKERYTVPSTGAFVDEKGCVSLLYQVHQTFCACEDLPDVSFEDHFCCYLRLSNVFPLSLRKYESAIMSNKRDAKRHVCMQAVKMLHENGWIGDNLFPLKFVKKTEESLGKKFFSLTDVNEAWMECNVSMSSKVLGIHVNFRSRIPESDFVEGFSTCFNDGVGAVHASVERVAAFSDSLYSTPIPCSSRIVMEDFEVADVDLLRVYSVDNSSVILIEKSGTAEKKFPDQSKASDFVEYFITRHGVTVDPKEQLWKCLRIHMNSSAPGKRFDKTMEIPFCLLKPKDSEWNRKNLWVERFAPIVFHRMQEEAMFQKNCARLQTSIHREALIPKSRCEESNLEKLEFLGDSVLKAFVSKHLYCCHEYPESVLTEMRSSLVCNENLAGVFHSLKLTLDPRNVAQFWKAESTEISTKGYADVVEAIIGSMFTESAEKCEHFLEKNIMGEKKEKHRDDSVVETDDFPDFLKHDFQDVSLLCEAFTHSSFVRSESLNYNRLEFLGDAILDLFVAKTLFDRYPEAGPSLLSSAKSYLVNTETLGRIAVEKGLVPFIRHCVKDIFFEEALNLPPFTFWLPDVPKMFADVVESVIGAFYVDCSFNLEKTFDFIHRLCQDIWNPMLLNPFVPDPVSLANEKFVGEKIFWSASEQALVVNGFEIARVEKPCRNWKRIAAAKACIMLDQCKELKEVLKRKRQTKHH